MHSIKQIKPFLEVCKNYLQNNNVGATDRFQHMSYSHYETDVLYNAALNKDRAAQDMLIGKACYLYERMREEFKEKGLPSIKSWPSGDEVRTRSDYAQVIKNATGIIKEALKSKGTAG